jgi:hypothetical protein
MEQPWFKLDPNNWRDKWWLYTSVKDTKSAFVDKSELDIVCYLMFKEMNMEDKMFYRTVVWFKDDPNRYMYKTFESCWKFDKQLSDMNEGDIVNTYSSSFKVFNCKYDVPSHMYFYKILERINI